MIRVLLAEDHNVVRGALAALLNLAADIEVVAEAVRGDQVVPAAVAADPDVAVIDIEMPGLDGLSAAARLRAAMPDCRVLILTGLARTAHLRRALDVGVDGFLLKDVPADRLAESIRRLAGGERVLDSSLAASAMSRGTSPLTDRESAVLAAIGSGATTVEIATSLCLSAATVRNYISSAIGKVGARNRVDAFRIATESGWI